MSTILAEILEVNEVTPHPNADRLDLIRIGGAITSRARGSVSVGDRVVYFPPNLLIPERVAEFLGVKQYLKHAVYPGDTEKTQCRVAACRLRGVASFGFAATMQEAFADELGFIDTGRDVSDAFQAVKYDPPPPKEFVGAGFTNTAEDHPLFHAYTDIENYARFPDAIPVGTPVRYTEKIHGINARFGRIDGEFQAGSHHCRLKPQAECRGDRYWSSLSVPLQEMLVSLAGESGLVPSIVFGEIFGGGIQDMDYGVPKGQRDFRVFDIAVNGRYLDWEELVRICDHFGVGTVPLLYQGPFDPTRLDEFTKGETVVGPSTGKFKGREGVVITPLREAFTPELPDGRMIIKYVGADYLDRKGAQDNA